jgi:hypothetical protein
VVVEPFLIVRIVAAVRRLIAISAEAENLLGTAQFRDVMLEIGILAGTALRTETPLSLTPLRRCGPWPVRREDPNRRYPVACEMQPTSSLELYMLDPYKS